MHDGNATQNNILTTLGRYRVIRRIGKGGMGDVWLCEDPSLRRSVAIKTLPSHSQTDREFALRFEREARAAAALNHPHILPVHDYGQQPLPDGQSITYIVMPYVAGGSLADRISTYAGSRFIVPTDIALIYLEQAAQAIDYAHEQGLIHRDIKPANMLLRADNWLLLADFGIARIMDSTEKLTQTGLGFGTPHYMAPEQAQGKAEFQSDNYSLAVIAYQLFAGRVPFNAETAYATTIQHLTMPPPPPHQFNSAISPILEAALLKGLEKQPAQRPPSAQAFVHSLQHALHNSAPFESTFVQGSASAVQGASPASYSRPADHQLAPQDSQTTTTVQQPATPQGTKEASGNVGAPRPALSRRSLLLGGAALAVAGGGLGIWALLPKTGTQPSSTAKPTAPSAAATGNQPLLLSGHDKPVATLAWSQAAMLASAGSQGDARVFLWDVPALYKEQSATPKPKTIREFHTGLDILLAWSPQGDMLAIANAENSSDLNSTRLDIYTGDLGSLAPGYNDTFIIKDTLAIDGLAWSPGENLMTLVHAKGFGAPDILTLWDAKHPQQALAQLNTPHNAYTDVGLTLTNNPLAVAPHTSPLMFALGTHDGISVEHIDLAKQPHIKENYLFTYGDNEKLTSGTKVVSWSADGRHLAGIKDNYNKPTSVAIWDLQTHTIPPACSLPDTEDTFLLTTTWCPAPASRKLAAGGNNGKIYIWDSGSNTLPIDIKTPPASIHDPVRALAWSADGQWLAAGYNDRNASIVVWKV